MSDHVDRSTGGAAGFGSYDSAGDTELLHHLKTDADAVAAGGLVAIVHAIDHEAVVSRAHAGEGKAAIHLDAAHGRGRTLRIRPG